MKKKIIEISMLDRNKRVLIEEPNGEWKIEGVLLDMHTHTEKIPMGNRDGVESFVPGRTEIGLVVGGWIGENLHPGSTITILGDA